MTLWQFMNQFTIIIIIIYYYYYYRWYKWQFSHREVPPNTENIAVL